MLNAIEARHALQAAGDECHLIFCRGVSDRNAEQIRALIDESEWSAVHYLPHAERPTTLRKRALALERIWKGLPKVDRLLVGHFGFSLGRHLANTFRPAEVFVLDDGTASHRTYANRFEDSQAAGGRGVRVYKRWAVTRHLKRLLLNVDSKPFEAVTFFTIYDHPIHACDRRIQNDYRHWRTKRPARIAPESIYFLGGCLVELGIVNAETYESLLLAAKERFRGARVRYIPHRREEAVRLERIAELTGWEVTPLPVPVEIHLLQSPTLPGILASLYSTALDSCHVLFSDLGMEIEAHVIPPEKIINAEQAAFIATVYSYYERAYGHSFALVRN